MRAALAHLLCVLPVCWAATAAAADATMDGQLRLPLCVIHDGANAGVSVDFGDSLNIARLGTGAYKKTVRYVVDCEDDVAGMPFELEIDGTPSAWSSSVLDAGREIGIRIELDGKPVVLGTAVNAARQSLPVLTAEPVTSPSGQPDEGVFSAIASFKARYY